MRFRPEPSLPSAGPDAALSGSEKIGILWCNLGSPDAPTAQAVRPYLAQFLADPRVVEIPRLLWMPILHGIVLRTRPAKSAAKYASIWLAEGAPLKVWSAKQAKLLQGWLGERGLNVQVRDAMRYGQPAIASQLDAFKAEGIARVLVLQGYPQYSGTTTASVIDAVNQWSRNIRALPEMRFVNQYHDDPGYIAALASSVTRHWQQQGRGQMLVMSFHGVPERTAVLGDPYQAQCLRTAQLLAEHLQLPKDQYRVTFQSRFGKAKWLQPYTEPTLRELAAAGVVRVDVVCPGFVGDCLETLEEIAMEARMAFLNAGGKAFFYIPCLNDSAEWITALADIAQRNLAGWTVGAAQQGQGS